MLPLHNKALVSVRTDAKETVSPSATVTSRTHCGQSQLPFWALEHSFPLPASLHLSIIFSLALPTTPQSLQTRILCLACKSNSLALTFQC